MPICLFQYTDELLRQQQFLEVYLEGTRSRSGKPSPACAGMLSIVVDTLCTGSIPDVLIVPVGISYDRIIEGNYNSEQLVGSTVPNSSSNWHCWGHQQRLLPDVQVLTILRAMSKKTQFYKKKRFFLTVYNFLQGKPKKNESLWGVACGVFRMLRKNYGCVRVDFTQPFSLKVRTVCRLRNFI